MVSITQIYDDLTRPINLFSLYAFFFFFQYMSYDNTPENCFIQILSYSKSQVPLGPLLEKQIKTYKIKSSIHTEFFLFMRNATGEGAPEVDTTTKIPQSNVLCNI